MNLTNEESKVLSKRILFVASECQPFSGTGGLADVICGLPKAIKKENSEFDVRVVLPLYSFIGQEFKSRFEYVGNKHIGLSWRTEYCGVFKFIDNDITYYFIDNEKYFKRDSAYGYNDDAERFAFFSKAVLEIFDIIDFYPDIIHTNDWQSALVPVYLKTNYLNDLRFDRIKTILNLHNVQYQGRFGISILTDVLGIDAKYRSILEHQNDVNFLKAGIQTADKIITVSQSYVEEIKHTNSGCGLNDVIKANSYKLTGILNGLDFEFYNPKTDKIICNNFDINSIETRKKNKEALQKEFGLKVDPNMPMVAVVTRMATHKGIDLIKGCMERFIIEDNIQLVGVGEGEFEYHNYFNYLNNKFPNQCHINIGYSLNIGKKIYSSADIFIMPSMVEPCGLAQMVASRYGCVPIVRETGGLKDSIKDFGCGECGNGYTFARYAVDDLENALKRALYDYKSDKKAWENKIKKCMSVDFSWGSSAKKYIEIYTCL